MIKSPRILATLAVSAIALAACSSAPAPTDPGAASQKDAKGAGAVGNKAKPIVLGRLPREGQMPIDVERASAKMRGIPRAGVEPETVRIDLIPQMDMPEALKATDAPYAMPSGNRAADLVVESLYPNQGNGYDPQYSRAFIKGASLARISIGGMEGGSVDGTGGVNLYCTRSSSSSARPVPARWETLAKGPNKTVTYEVTDAWFDMNNCEASIVARTKITPTPILDGALLAYRSKDEKVLRLIAPPLLHPSTATGVGGAASVNIRGFTVVSLPLVHGGGGSFLGRVIGSQTRNWPTGQIDGDVVIGLEVSQAVGEETAIAIGYISEPDRDASVLSPSHIIRKTKSSKSSKASPAPPQFDF